MKANPALMELTDQPVLFFDGVCNLCNGFVDFLVKRDRKRIYRYAPLQGKTADYALPSDVRGADSFVFCLRGEVYLRSSAALKVLAGLGGVWSLARFLLWIPIPVRDGIYRLIATNRYRVFGRKDTCRLPRPEERELFLP